MRSVIAILTYRRGPVVKAFLDSLAAKCPGYKVAVFEDCANADNTFDLLTAGAKSAGKDAELEADVWEHPNYTLFMGWRNNGVSGNSNKAIRWFMRQEDAGHLCLCNDDLVASGDFVKRYEDAHRFFGVGLWCFCDFTSEQYRPIDVKVKGRPIKLVPRRVGIMMSITRALVDKIGFFDTSFGRFGEEHSLPAGTLVLAGDYTWRPIENIQIGEEIIGWSKRETQAPRYSGRKNSGKGFWNSLHRTPVTKTHRYQSKVVELTLKSGRRVICTPDHLWFNGKVYKEPRVGMKLKSVFSPIRFSGFDKDYANGYLEGAITGDGTRNDYSAVLRVTDDEFVSRVGDLLNLLAIPFSRAYKKYPVVTTGRVKTGESRPMTQIIFPKRHLTIPATDSGWKGWLAGMYDAEGHGASIAQSQEVNPEKCALIGAALHRFGFKYTGQKKQINITGGRRELLRFWNTVRPACSYKLDTKMLTGLETQSDEIVGVVELPEAVTVFCLTTDSGNYIADGYASHNCDYNHRAMMCGLLKINGQDQHCLDVPCPELAHQEVQSSIYPFEKKALDQEAATAMQQVTARYNYKARYRPFLLCHGKLAGGYDGGGLPVRELEELGYTLIVDSDLNDAGCTA